MTDPSLDALRAGDEDSFRELVTEHSSALMRLALIYSPSRALAEEAVQETWIAALRSLDSFEGRASLRTWLSKILINTARRRAGSEVRSMPFSAVGEPAVDPSRFMTEGAWVGHWTSFPVDPRDVPEVQLQAAEIRARVREAITHLKPPQREVFVLRDVEGWSGEEVADREARVVRAAHSQASPRGSTRPAPAATSRSSSPPA